MKLFDREIETSDEFRLATNEGVNDELKLMHYRWGSPEPTVDVECDGAKHLIKLLEPWSPPREAAPAYVKRFAVETHPNEIADLLATVEIEVGAFLRRHDIDLLSSELEQLVDNRYLEVFRRASRNRTTGETGRIAVVAFRAQTLSIAHERLVETESSSRISPGEQLRQQLMAVGSDPAVVQQYVSERRAYQQLEVATRGSPEGDALGRMHANVSDICRREAVLGAANGDTGAEILERILAALPLLPDESSHPVASEIRRGMCFYQIGRSQLRLA